MKIVKIIVGAFLMAPYVVSGVVWADDSGLVNKWGGTWENVESLQKRMPEEQRFKTVNIYDYLIISDVTAMGFNYRNVGNDVGYGPNEQTYSQGNVLFTKDGNAEDRKNEYVLIFYQGNDKWDRGISIGLKSDNNKKIFKQVRTRFDASFNCDRAGTHIEKRLCAVAVLARADKELGKRYHNLRKTLAADEAALLKKSQRAWVKKRNKICQDKIKTDDACLAQHYVTRLVYLRRMSDPTITDKSSVIDHGFMKSIYKNSPYLWNDVVTQLIFKSQNQDEFYRQWMTFKPVIKAISSENEVIFTGAFEYETIIWPANVIVKKAFQWIINAKGQQWFSSRTENGNSVEIVTHFGDKKPPESVLNWVNMKQ